MEEGDELDEDDDETDEDDDELDEEGADELLLSLLLCPLLLWLVRLLLLLLLCELLLLLLLLLLLDESHSDWYTRGHWSTVQLTPLPNSPLIGVPSVSDSPLVYVIVWPGNCPEARKPQFRLAPEAASQQQHSDFGSGGVPKHRSHVDDDEHELGELLEPGADDGLAPLEAAADKEPPGCPPPELDEEELDDDELDNEVREDSGDMLRSFGKKSVHRHRGRRHRRRA